MLFPIVMLGLSVMGFDLFAFPERLEDGRYETDTSDRFFDWRHHGMWSFLGGWDEDLGVPCIARERGFPADGVQIEPFMSEGLPSDIFGMSWLSVQELLDYDYDTAFVGRFRNLEDGDGHVIGYIPDPEAATNITVRTFLAPDYFKELARLAASGAERIVFFYA